MKNYCFYVFIWTFFISLVHARSATQSCPTLCDPMDCTPPASSVHRIFPATILKWVAISFSRESSWTQRLKLPVLHLLFWQVESLPPGHLGSPQRMTRRQVLQSPFIVLKFIYTIPVHIVCGGLNLYLKIVCRTPLSVGFYRQQYRSGLPFPSPGALPKLGIKPVLLCFLHGRQMLYAEPPGKPISLVVISLFNKLSISAC